MQRNGNPKMVATLESTTSSRSYITAHESIKVSDTKTYSGPTQKSIVDKKEFSIYSGEDESIYYTACEDLTADLEDESKQSAYAPMNVQFSSLSVSKNSGLDLSTEIKPSKKSKIPVPIKKKLKRLTNSLPTAPVIFETAVPYPSKYVYRNESKFTNHRIKSIKPQEKLESSIEIIAEQGIFRILRLNYSKHTDTSTPLPQLDISSIHHLSTKHNNNNNNNHYKSDIGHLLNSKRKFFASPGKVGAGTLTTTVKRDFQQHYTKNVNEGLVASKNKNTKHVGGDLSSAAIKARPKRPSFTINSHFKRVANSSKASGEGKSVKRNDSFSNSHVLLANNPQRVHRVQYRIPLLFEFTFPNC